MDIVKLVGGFILTIVGGWGSSKLVMLMLKGIASGNLAAVVGAGILSYFFLMMLVVFLLAGIVLLFEGIFE